MRKKKIMPSDEKFRTILGRLTATAFYEMQEMRISQTNMIRDIIRRKDLGIAFNEVEKKMEEKTYDKDYADKLLKDRITAMFKQGKLTEKEATYITIVLDNIKKIEEQEKSYCKLLAEYVKDEPIYTEFLQHIRGISFVLTANLLRFFGYCDGKKENGDELCPTISSLWKYTGLAPDQKRTKGEKANYNPKAKVLAWKIADSMLKQRTPIYRDIYDAEKIRQEEILSKVDGEKAVKMHSHLRAMRKMVKMFLCYSEDTEVLTKKGFKFIKEASLLDEIATLNPLTKELEYQKPSKIYSYNYNNDLIYFNGRNYNLLVTPNHNLFVKSRYRKEFEFIPAEYFITNSSSNWEFIKNANWNNKKGELNEIILQEARYNDGRNLMNGKEKRIPIEIWLKFFGWWISDGHVYKSKKYAGGYQVGITTKDKLNEIKKVFEQMGFKPFISNMQVLVSSKQLFSVLKKYGKSYEKYIPQEIKELSKKRLRILFDALIDGDGERDKKGRPFRYHSTSKRLSEDVAEIGLKCGYGISFAKRIQEYNQREIYRVTFTRDKNTPRISSKPCKVKYCGKVWCAEVPNHIMLIRRKGKVIWCGNSHYWLCAREIKGLPVTKPYIIGKGNHSHFVDWKEVVEANKIKAKTKVQKAKKTAKKKK